MSDHVWVKNPATGGVWACPNDYLRVALARGWEPSDPPGEDEYEAPAQAPVEAPVVEAPAPKKRTTTKTGD